MKTKRIRKAAHKLSLPPGSLVYVGEQKTADVRITIIDYDDKKLTEQQIDQIEQCLPFKQSPTATWINIDGIHQVDIVEKIGAQFNLHPLTLEDIVHPGQRPKLEDQDDYLYVVLEMLTFNDNDQTVQAEQVSLVLSDNCVISFQEYIGDVLDPLRQRLRQNKGRIRKTQADYLFYCLIDTIIDHYFVVLENLGDKIETLQEEVISNPQNATLHKIHQLKREIIGIRKAVWPVRELMAGLQKTESELISSPTQRYLNDAYDHIIQIIDTAETLRDMIGGLLDVYLNSISNRMNAVMKVLTIFATIFMPLTFLAGIYGMNFEHMPELKFVWAYPALLVTMVVVALGMAFYFKKKNWL